MYDKILKQLEECFNASLNTADVSDTDANRASKLADLIIKIKTIQALDTSAELIAASRRVSRN